MEIVKSASGRHQINNFDNFKFFITQIDQIPDYGFLTRINDCTWMLASKDDIADFINIVALVHAVYLRLHCPKMYFEMFVV